MGPHTSEDTEPLTGFTTNSDDQFAYTPSDDRYFNRDSNSDDNSHNNNNNNHHYNNQRPRIDRQTSSSSSRTRIAVSRFLNGTDEGSDQLRNNRNDDGSLIGLIQSSIPGNMNPRVLLTLWFIFVAVMIGLMIGFRSKIFGLLESLATFIKGLGAFGPPLLMFCLFATSFPPIIGYSSIITMTGYAYGFLFGFAIAFTSALAGSIVCFYFCRRWFKPQVRKLMAKNKSLKSVVRTVEKRGFRLLVLIRLAPYPFNIMNALLSATHISLQTFALATGMSLLKLTLHVYIGSTLSSLNEDDGPDDPNNPNKKHGGKALKIFVMVTSILFGIGIGLYVWVVARREIAIVEASRLDRRRRRRREESLRRGLSTNPNSGIELNDNIPGLDLGSRGLSLDQDNRSGRQGGEFTDLVGGYRTNYRNEEDDDHEDQSLFGLGGGGNQQRQPQGDSWRNVGANVDSSTDSDNSDFLDDDDDDEDDEFEDNGHDYGVDLNIQERGNSFLGGNRTNNYRDIAQNDEDDEGALDFSAHHIGLSDSPWRDDDEERGL